MYMKCSLSVGDLDETQSDCTTSWSELIACSEWSPTWHIWHISRQFLRYVLAFFLTCTYSHIHLTYVLTLMWHIFWQAIWHFISHTYSDILSDIYIYNYIYIIIYIYCMYVDIWSAIFYAFYLTLCMAFFLAFDLAFYLTSCWSNMINLHTIWRALSHILWHSTWHIFWHSLTLYVSFDPTFDMHFFLRV